MTQNVLIIGASGDIGSAIAKERIQKGDQLILHCNANEKALEKLAFGDTKNQILQLIRADLTTADGIEKLLASIAFDVNSIIFANGKTKFQLFQDTSIQSMKEMLTLHVEAPWRITGRLLPFMIRHQAGKIIFITSVWGEAGASNEVLYSTVKGAQNSFVKSLAKEVAPSGIAVHAVSPGFIDTKMNLSLTQEEKQVIYEEIPLKRPGLPGEVAAAVGFLMDQKGLVFTGQVLPVSGGWMI